MRRGGVRLRRVRELQVQGLVDQLPARDVVPVDQRDRGALGARAAGAADAVEVGLLVLRRLVVDDVGHTLDVDTARGDVGADQDVDLAVAEGAQRLLAGALAEVAVDRAGGEAALLQLLGDVGGRALRPAEDHREPAALGLEDAGEHLRLVHVVGAVDVLDRVLHGRALVVGRRGVDVRRLRHVAAGEADDGTGHGGREQHRLALGRQHRDDALDVGQEAQVQHLVGLVEDEPADVGEVELALARQVQETARGADDHIDALLEGLDLGLVRPAAVDRENADVTDLAGREQVVGDLGAQLAGGDDDERLRRVGQLLGLGPPGLDVGGDGHALQEREAEAERLSGAGLGLADDVGAGEGDGERQLLDGEGGRDADRLKGFGRLGKNTEVAERSQGAASSVRRGPRRTLGVVPCRVGHPAVVGPGGAGPLPSLERSCR
ncbi:hypothetical protein A3Q37_06966 [Streptomyces sp. PTY087I2]|nr:hypothetical protein A3Q37_06966 [Streptomyces sp. PTY087I2]